MKFRFKACDQGTAGIVEAGIDNYAIETFTSQTRTLRSRRPCRPPALEQNEPNPFNPMTTIKFTLSNPAQARLEIYDTPVASCAHSRTRR